MEELETLVPILNPEMGVRLVSLISENRRLLEEKATHEREARDWEKANKGLEEALEKINQLQGLLKDKKMEVKFLRVKLENAVESLGDIGPEAFENFKRKQKDLEGVLASVELRHRKDGGVAGPTFRQRSIIEKNEGTSVVGSRRVVGVNQVNTSDDTKSIIRDAPAPNDIVTKQGPPVSRTDEDTSQPGGPPTQPENEVSSIAGPSTSGAVGLDKNAKRMEYESETGSDDESEEPKDDITTRNGKNNSKDEGKRHSNRKFETYEDSPLPPNPPKRPRSSFLEFQMEQLSAMKDTRLGKGEKYKAIGQEWRNMDDSAKETYRERAQMSAGRFERQKKSFTKKCEEKNLTIYTPANPKQIMKPRK